MAGTSGTPFSSSGPGITRGTKREDPNNTKNYYARVEQDIQRQVKQLKKDIKQTTSGKASKAQKMLSKLNRMHKVRLLE